MLDSPYWDGYNMANLTESRPHESSEFAYCDNTITSIQRMPNLAKPLSA